MSFRFLLYHISNWIDEYVSRTTILGNKFSAPLFISPAAAPGLIGGYVPENKELGLVKGAGIGGILYIPAQYAEMSIEEMGQEQLEGQTMFQQVSTIKNVARMQHWLTVALKLYADPTNRTLNQETLTRAEKAGKKAVVWTVDAPADGAWVRGARFTLPPRPDLALFTWDFYDELRNMTSLPIIPKGITSVEDAKIAVSKGAPAIILSNHGGRHLDGAPSSLQTALEIHDEAPEIFKQTEVLADGGVRYGGDVLKLLALGCKAVGLGRSFMYANLYGKEGVERAIELLKQEMYLDAVNLGLSDLNQLDISYVRILMLILSATSD